MTKYKLFKPIFLFTGLAIVMVLIFGGRHFGIPSISDLLNPLRGSNKTRPKVLIAGIQPMVIWKKIKVSALVQPAETSTNLAADADPITEPISDPALNPKPEPVIESAPHSISEPTTENVGIVDKVQTPAPPPQEPAVVAVVELQSIEPQKPSVPETVLPKNPSPPLPYTLQLASYRSVKNAQNSQNDLNKRGLDVYLSKIQLDGERGTWWRIFAGQYETLEDALGAQKTLGLSDAIVKKTPYANLVGEYASLDELRTEQQRLTNLGVSSYILEGPNSSYRLFVGAYAHKSQAERQALELKSMGLISQTITR